MNKIRMHFIKMFIVMFVTISAFSVFGYTNVYGKNVINNSNSIVEVVKEVKVKSSDTSNTEAKLLTTTEYTNYVQKVNHVNGNSITVVDPFSGFGGLTIAAAKTGYRVVASDINQVVAEWFLCNDSLFLHLQAVPFLLIIREIV